MKKIRITMITALAIISVASFFAFKARPASPADSGVIIIRTFQLFVSDNSVMHIYYGNGKFEEVKLKKLRADTQHENWGQITDTINKFYADGYKLVSSTERGENSINSTFILSK